MATLPPPPYSCYDVTYTYTRPHIFVTTNATGGRIYALPYEQANTFSCLLELLHYRGEGIARYVSHNSIAECEVLGKRFRMADWEYYIKPNVHVRINIARLIYKNGRVYVLRHPQAEKWLRRAGLW